MAHFLHNVADLLEGRDREDLEVTLARVTFELAGARALALWRAFRRVDGVWLRKRVALSAAGDAIEPREDDVPLAEASEPLRLAYQSKVVTRCSDPEGCVLPVAGPADTLALIEIELSGELDRDNLTTLLGMLRIYRSHLAALDYGDTDELTRLANRRPFDDQFTRLAQAEGRRLGDRRGDDDFESRAHLGVADIDHFKRVNDRFGHPYGDEVLMLFADLMRKTFRETDRLFRFGGEEFVILLSNCGRDDALMVFERFRAAVEGFDFPQVRRVTVSIGVTAIRRLDGGSAAFGRADQALYVAKRSGRNRVQRYDELAHDAVAQAPGDVELFEPPQARAR